MSRIGDPVIRQQDVSAQDWDKLKGIAALDGDATSISKADLKALANPNMTNDVAARTIAGNDFTAQNLHSGGDIVETDIRGRSGSSRRQESVSDRMHEIQDRMNALGNALDGKAGFTINRSGRGSVASIEIQPDARQPLPNEMNAGQLTTFFQQFVGGTGTQVFNGGQAEVLHQLDANPGRCQTTEVAGEDKTTLSQMVRDGWYPVASKTETVTTPGTVDTKTEKAPLGDLYPSGGDTPDPGKLNLYGDRLAALISDGYSISGLTTGAGTDAQPVTEGRFAELAQQNLFTLDANGKCRLEQLGYECPYAPTVTYDDIRKAVADGTTAELAKKLRSLENAPNDEMKATFGDRQFNGNILLAFSRDAGVRSYLIGRPDLHLTAESFTAPTIHASIKAADGSLNNRPARNTSVDIKLSREIEGSGTSREVTTYTMARYEPLTELKPKVVVGFDISPSVTTKEKALFLLGMHEAFTSGNYPKTGVKLQYFNADGAVGEGKSFVGTPEKMTCDLAIEVLGLRPPAEVTPPTGTQAELEAWVFGKMQTLAASGAPSQGVAYDDSPGEMGRTEDLNVPRRLMNMRTEIGGAEAADVIIFTDIDNARMRALEGEPFGFRFFNPANH